MLRLKSDLVAHCQAALNGTLDSEQADWESRPSVGIVLQRVVIPAAMPRAR